MKSSDIVCILDEKGISCHGVKLNLNNLKTVTMPFIQYLAADEQTAIGHFVLCIPNKDGKAVVLDGDNEPKVVDLSLYKADNIKQTRWDGTAVLIEGMEENFKQSLISWRILVLYSGFWLSSVNDSDGFISQDLTNSDMKTLLGGWRDYDCNNVGKNCNTNNICYSHSDCSAGKWVCADQVEEEKCQLTQYGWRPCYYDLARTCQPLKMQDGICGTPGQRCGEATAGYGLCSVSPKNWISQCHDGWW
jgi:hypothetical protein